jgi:hypothetical protein
LEVCNSSRVLVFGEAEELDVAAQDFGPTEVLGQPKERCSQQVLAALATAELGEEVEPQDVV